MLHAPSLEFGHPAQLLRQWRDDVGRALAAGASTPFFLLNPKRLAQPLQELEMLDFGRPVRHWYSCKTQPAPPLLRWWRSQGRPIEVVSEFEFRAALAVGFAPEQILVNGPAKHHWLPAVKTPGIRVHFDSFAEAQALAQQARKNQWRLGIRFHPGTEIDPENPERPTQFGHTAAEFIATLRHLRKHRLEPDALSFHLRTNIPDPSHYQAALQEAAALCHSLPFKPRYLDCGGGLPPPWILMKRGKRYDSQMSLPALAEMYRRALKGFPSVEELWLENGRHLLARTGVLVVRILDIKERDGLRQLICNGGRTMNALISTWEHHALHPLENRRGMAIPTVVHGPTCMAFDQLGVRQFPKSLRAGDHLVWFDAGAYHIPWETHFSHGLASIWSIDGQTPACERGPESFDAFWGRWNIQ